MTAQWELRVLHLHTIVDGLTLPELAILELLVARRRREMNTEPAQVIDMRGLRDAVLIEAQRLNEIGLERYRRGYAEYDAFEAIATPADQAMHDSKFRRVLEAIVAGAIPRPTKGA